MRFRNPWVRFLCHAFREKAQTLYLELRKSYPVMQKCFVHVGRDYISRRWIEFRDDFGVYSLRQRNYGITWVNETQSEFQCIVTNTHLYRSIDLFPINDFHYDVIGAFRSKDEKQDAPNVYYHMHYINFKK